LPCIGKNRYERAWCKCRYRSTLICKSHDLPKTSVKSLDDNDFIRPRKWAF
jgi:hypothetical protein